MPKQIKDISQKKILIPTNSTIQNPNQPQIHAPHINIRSDKAPSQPSKSFNLAKIMQSCRKCSQLVCKCEKDILKYQ